MDLIIFGTGGLAREIHQLIKDIKVKDMSAIAGRRQGQEESLEFRGFLDDDSRKHNTNIHGYPVLGGIEWLGDKPNVGVVVAVGNPLTRKNIVTRVREQCDSQAFPTIIHPSAIIGDGVEIGRGTIICAGTIITADAVIGDHVIVNLDCTIAHDDIIKNFVTMAPSVNISGDVKVGQGTDLGTSAVVIQGIDIGDWSIIGAGTVVIRDIPENVTAVGNPARIIKERSPSEL